MRRIIGNNAAWWLRLALGTGAVAVIAWLLEPDEIFAAASGAYLPGLAVALVLLIPNLWLQYRKWRYLLRAKGYGLPDGAVWQSLLYGFALGIVTPARVGEFGGRLMTDRSLQNTSALGLVAADKFAAMIITVAFGVFALGAWGMHFGWFGEWIAGGLALLALGMPLLVWHSIRSADALLDRWKSTNIAVRAVRRLSDATRKLTVREYCIMLLYSTAFYLTFVLQFAVLLLAFEPGELLYLFLGISCVMVAKTIVPPVTLGELGIREGFSVFFLAMIGISPAAAFSASLLLFTVNILLPATAGGLLLLRTTIQPRYQE